MGHYFHEFLERLGNFTLLSRHYFKISRVHVHCISQCWLRYGIQGSKHACFLHLLQICVPNIDLCLFCCQKADFLKVSPSVFYCSFLVSINRVAKKFSLQAKIKTGVNLIKLLQV